MLLYKTFLPPVTNIDNYCNLFIQTCLIDMHYMLCNQQYFESIYMYTSETIDKLKNFVSHNIWTIIYFNYHTYCVHYSIRPLI